MFQKDMDSGGPQELEFTSKCDTENMTIFSTMKDGLNKEFTKVGSLSTQSPFSVEPSSDFLDSVLAFECARVFSMG